MEIMFLVWGQFIKLRNGVIEKNKGYLIFIFLSEILDWRKVWIYLVCKSIMVEGMWEDGSCYSGFFFVFFFKKVSF